ncbi:MAG TPA: hypothetical protein VF148_02140 [Acidimicrobiia bacterium]
MLAVLGARVIIVGRSAAKLESAQNSGGHHFVPERADRSLLEEVRQLAQPFLRTPAQGADTMVWLSVAEPPSRSSGGFWFDRSPTPTHLSEKTKETAGDRTRLWNRLAELTNSDVQPD